MTASGWKRSLLSWVLAAAAGLLLAAAFRSMVAQRYRLASESMEAGLPRGAVVWVDKTAYGIRLPMTPVAMPLLGEPYWDALRLGYHRLGRARPRRGDLLAFNDPQDAPSPIDKRPLLLRRCAALPGDTLSILGKNLWVNGDLQAFPERGLLLFRLGGDSLACLEPDSAQRLAQRGIRLERVGGVPGHSDTSLFTALRFPFWNADHIEGLVVPQRGMSIPLDARHYSCYRHAIVRHEGHQLEMKAGQCFLDGQASATYQFEQDYFFVLSDNRDAIRDSRFWGFVPESHVVGRVSED